ncbi:PLDc N-terminal domain-containing protein [Leifsonia aquatica]|uniref:PLDc N-terminal domain-containing protein n=1 Tax=Leifsonia aquatica TaxID=144185 RepID=UPI00046A94DC|nr:PLDc N-terminal domain-containing protein [Leifsonia aquatica]
MSIEPQIPVAFDVVGILLGVLIAGLTIASIVAIARARWATPAQCAMWVVIAIAVPIIGAVAWFVTAHTQIAPREDDAPTSPPTA